MTTRSAPRVTVLLAGVVALGACSSGGESTEDTTERPSTTTTTVPGPPYDAGPVRFDAGVIPGSHDCVPPDADDVEIAWEELRNPIYEEPAMTKDQTVRFVDGRWHMWFSTRSRDEQGYATSTDWTDWEIDEDHAPPVGGSSDITRAANGEYVLTLQVEDDRPRADSRKVAYRTRDDPAGFADAEVRRIAPGIYDDERLIDAALAHTEHGVFAIFKRGLRETLDQTPTLVYSPSGDLEGPWELVGDVESIGLAENFQLLTIDGKWHLLVTAIPFHDPTLFRLEGDPLDPASWLDWDLVGAFAIPEEDWNTGDHDTRGITYDVANSAYLCDARVVDGHFYLFYAGATELESNDGRGHQRIGVARSTDLVTWELPGA